MMFRENMTRMILLFMEQQQLVLYSRVVLLSLRISVLLQGLLLHLRGLLRYIRLPITLR